MFVLGRLSLILLLGCNQVGLQEVIKWDHVLKTWVHYITLFWVCLFVCFGYTAQASQVVLAVTNLPAKAEVIRDMGSIPGKIPWRRVWQSTPIFLPGKFHGQRSLVGYSPWGHEELDTTEFTHTACRTSVLWPEIEPGPWQWVPGTLTRLPGSPSKVHYITLDDDD